MVSDNDARSGEGKVRRRELTSEEVVPTEERPPVRPEAKPEAVPPPVPRGKSEADIEPTSDPVTPRPVRPPRPTEPPRDDPVVFETDTPVGDVTPTANTVVDACGGASGRAVMVCGNLWALYSDDAGATFVDVPLGSAFEMSAQAGVRGDPAGDQVIHYIPAIDRFVWVMLYYPEAGGLNAFGLALAKPSDLAASAGRSGWYRWTFPSTFFDLGANFMDFPDLAVTEEHLYLSFSSAMGSSTNGFVVARIRLEELDGSGSIGVEFTDLADSNGMFHGRLVQEPRGQAIWAAHVDTDTLRVFTWPDNDATTSWRDIDVQPWPIDDYTSMTPPVPSSTMAGQVAVNWLGAAFASVAAGVQRRDDVILGWTAGRGGGFPHPHVRLVTLNAGNWSVVREAQIWHSEHAWAYPWLAVNAPEEVGIAIGWGGGGIHFGSSAFGIPEDHVLWYSEPSDTAIARWGDYVTARRSARNRSLFAGFGYTLRYDSSIDGPRANTRYTHFGRESAI
jgi:hypothetical protein